MTGADAALDALVEGLRVTGPDGFDLDRFPTHPELPAGLEKDGAALLAQTGLQRLQHLQERLYAGARWAVLVVIQAMDAAGKDGTIAHVMSGVNPQGVFVTAFKAPGPEDLAHDFLWRPTRALPARGMIGIFNRSHYEDVLVPRVHPEALLRQRLPPGPADGDAFWRGRLDDIVGFERHLGREGTKVVKLFLDVSRDEQKRRLIARLDDPDKLWKFDPADVRERRRWDDYRASYQAAIAATATPDAPWFIVPADRKWLMRAIAMRIVVSTLEGLDLTPAAPDAGRAQELAEARRALEAET